jgi:hypothetical protein
MDSVFKPIKDPTYKMPIGVHTDETKRQPNSIPATANVGFAKRLVLDSPPEVPGHRCSSSRRRLLCREGSSRYHNILVPHAANGVCLRAACRVGPRTSHSAKIDNRNGSRSSFLLLHLLALSAADRRISPLVSPNTAADTAAAGSRAPLGDTMLLFELF